MYKQPGDQKFSRSGSITFYTLLCFSLAGLIMGFGIGGFAGHLASTIASHTSSSSTSEPVLTEHKPVSSSALTPENIALGVPAIGPGDYASSQVADGTTSYQFSTQIINKADNTPLISPDVTCRLWLANDPPATTAGLSANNFALPRAPALFNQPFPDEITNALNFTSPSAQVQPCTTNGKTTWHYTLSPDVPGGTYYLVVLADWKGIHYNWYMVAVNVSGQPGDDSSTPEPVPGDE